MVSRVLHHQPVLGELVNERCQLTDRPAVADDVDNIKRRWNVITVELEQLTRILERVVSLWTEYIQLVSRLHEHLSNVSDTLQSDIRPNIHTANLTSLDNVLKKNQVFYLVDLHIVFYCTLIVFSLL